eukprot:TRINITY_DN24856_c0_g1_i1.p1 TRINITY_DN24856_c0_g1~~TRINITY_DN24856_c0_g1_i1.p1  ORF type:complete len:492 (-),score=65.22 TRINITY_DN24856_c0_g1_i1:459-1934(-)
MERWRSVFALLALCLHTLGAEQADELDEAPTPVLPSNFTETDLRNYLLDGYRYGSLPRYKNRPIDLDLGMNIVALSSMSQLEGRFTMNVWMRLRWNDYRLKWPVRRNAEGACQQDRPSDLPCMMTFPTIKEYPDAVWTPDVLLYNTAEKPLAQLLHTQVVAYPDGTISWSRPGIMTATCKFELADFPNDVQDCYLEFGSWSYDAGTLAIRLDEYFKPAVEFDPTTFIQNEEWQFEYDEYVLKSQYFSCCKYPYQVFRIYFKATRKAYFFNTVFVYPAIVLTASIVLSIGIPWNSGERVSYVTDMILTIVLFLVAIAAQLPKTEQETHITTIFMYLLYSSVAFLVATVFSVRFAAYFHQKEEAKHRENQNKLLATVGGGANNTAGKRSSPFSLISNAFSSLRGSGKSSATSSMDVLPEAQNTNGEEDPIDEDTTNVCEQDLIEVARRLSEVAFELQQEMGGDDWILGAAVPTEQDTVMPPLSSSITTVSFFQ